MVVRKRPIVHVKDLINSQNHVRNAILKIYPVKDEIEEANFDTTKIEKEVAKSMTSHLIQSINEALLQGKAVEFGSFKIETFESQAVKKAGGMKARMTLRKRFKDELNKN